MRHKSLGQPLFLLAITFSLIGTMLFAVEKAKEQAMVAGLDGSSSVTVLRQGVKHPLRAGSYIYEGDKVIGGTADTKLSLLHLKESKLLVISLKAGESKAVKELLSPNQPSTLQTVLSSLRKAILGEKEEGIVELGGIRDGQGLQPTLAKSESVTSSAPKPPPPAFRTREGRLKKSKLLRQHKPNMTTASFNKDNYSMTEGDFSQGEISVKTKNQQTLNKLIGTMGASSGSSLSGGKGSGGVLRGLVNNEPEGDLAAMDDLAPGAGDGVLDSGAGGGLGRGGGGSDNKELAIFPSTKFMPQEFADILQMATSVMCRKGIGAPYGLISLSLPTNRKGKLLFTLVKNGEIVCRVPAYKTIQRAVAVVDLTKFKVQPGDAIYYYLENEIPRDHIWFRVLTEDFYSSQQELLKRASEEEVVQVKRAILLLAAQRYRDSGAYFDAYENFTKARELSQPSEAKELEIILISLRLKMNERP